MMRSLYSGVSGLQNHQIRMDVIGNNISNVNTIGYKKARVTFQDIFSQYLDSPSQPNEKRGGINPKQVGLGVTVASIDNVFTEGSPQTTGIKTDLAINGNGFFVLRNGSEELYTRAGAFDVDSEGWLVNPANGMRVQGWNRDLDSEINATGPVEDIRIPLSVKDPAKATTEVRMRSNLNKNTAIIPEGATEAEVRAGTWVVEQDIYDAYGNKHILQLNFTREPDTVDNWRVNAIVNPQDENPVPLTISVNGVDSADTSFLINFDNNGVIQGITNDAGGADTEGGLQVQFTYEVPNTSPVLNDAGILAPETQTFQLDVGNVGNFTESITQFASSSSTKVYFQDGYEMGYLKDFTIDRAGYIVGSYTNQQKRQMAQIALASFMNPEGLSKVGETNFERTINSGYANIGAPETEDKGVLRSGKLEMSNVDLAEEFTDMIITQRGFQANSRTIRTSDQMLQEVLTLKQ